MRIFSFHLMPYDRLPADYDGPSWITCPNSFYDPEHGNELYNRYIDELVLAAELGLDGVCVNEHHQNAYGNMPSPNLIASILAREVPEPAKIAVVGNALPLYDPPARVGEEFAMIDVISGGRLIAGFVVGGGPEYYSFGVNPAEARGRFYEAHDLIVESWTRDGPFAFNGKYYKYKYVNPWPRPIQKPFPEIWVPGVGSLETMEFVARRRYAYMGIPYFHIDTFERTFATFREIVAKEGYTPSPYQMGWLVPIFVAETDEQARELYEDHIWYFAKRLLPGISIQPPGYTSERSIVNIMKAMSGGSKPFMLDVESWEQLVEGEYVIVGSPDTVYERLAERVSSLGVGNLLALLQLGTMGHDITEANIRMFAGEVAPRLRETFGEFAAAPAPLTPAQVAELDAAEAS